MTEASPTDHFHSPPFFIEQLAIHQNQDSGLLSDFKRDQKSPSGEAPERLDPVIGSPPHNTDLHW